MKALCKCPCAKALSSLETQAPVTGAAVERKNVRSSARVASRFILSSNGSTASTTTRRTYATGANANGRSSGVRSGLTWASSFMRNHFDHHSKLWMEIEE